jgi:hypothetical protein
MANCTIEDCNLQKYETYDECILHCEKEINFRFEVQVNDFYTVLKNKIQNLMKLVLF